jgi:hypothetical protein
LLYQLCDALEISVFNILPKDEFDQLSTKRFSEKEKIQVKEIADNAKEKGKEYEPPEFRDNNK